MESVAHGVFVHYVLRTSASDTRLVLHYPLWSLTTARATWFGVMATSSRTTLSYVLTVGALVAVAGVSEAGESEGRSRPANSR